MKKSKKVMRHSPKDKKTNRPRPQPVEPLSEEVRLDRAIQEFHKAETLLREARTLAANGSTPHACVHSAYYAMHHCARAVLFKSGGVGKARDVPASHEHVIEHFGKLLVGAADAADNLGRILNRARGERVRSDYDLDDEITAEQAKEAAGNASHLSKRARSAGI
jgi:uncharacterized protein (UPF0332 family)